MYNKRYKKSNKIMYVMCTIIVILIYTISVCYSTLSRNLEISGLVKVRMQADIRVTGISIESNTDSVSNWEEYNVKNISSEVELTNKDSSITYKVRITNFGNVDMGIYTIDGLNDKLEYTLREDYKLKDKILKGGTQKDIYITIKYREGSYDENNTKYNILLNFDFRPYYTITYTNFPSDTNSLPHEIIKGDTLELDLSQYGKSRLTIKLDGLELSSIGYTYDNYKLNIPSVEGNIEIIYKKMSDIELVLRENDNNKTLSEDIQAGMYRYQGSYEEVTNNYICFGTSSKEECLQNEDKYMYRIIGITDDGQLELIKMTALNDTGVPWNSVYQSVWNTNTEVNEKTVDADVPWSQSDLFKRLNGLSDDNLFINSDSYDYMQEDSIWYNKIIDTNWLSGALRWNAESFKLENIYQIETGQKEALYYEEANPYYYNGGIEIVANTEPYVTRRNQDSVICERFDNLSINKVSCYKVMSKKFDDMVKTKIGIMYAYDYDYSVQKDGFNCFYDNIWNPDNEIYKNNREICKQNWIHLSHNDEDKNEWTMLKYGFSHNSDVYYIWGIQPLAYIVGGVANEYRMVRPVFYLTTDIVLKKGTTGAKDNPYIIANNMDGYVQDLSGNNNYGISYAANWNDEGITTSNEQKIGYVDCGLAGYDFNQTMTVIMRVKWNGYTNNDFQCFGGNISGPGDARIGFDFSMYRGTNNPYIDIYDSTHMHGSLYFGTIELEKWNTLVAVYDKGNLTLYLNGQKSNINILDLTTSKLPFYLGAYPNEDLSPSQPYDYSLTTFSDLLIYDRALSEDEVNSNYINTINKDKINKKDLLLYYKFDS